jgi:hypothetical protein
MSETEEEEKGFDKFLLCLEFALNYVESYQLCSTLGLDDKQMSEKSIKILEEMKKRTVKVFSIYSICG